MVLSNLYFDFIYLLHNLNSIAIFENVYCKNLEYNNFGQVTLSYNRK